MAEHLTLALRCQVKQIQRTLQYFNSPPANLITNMWVAFGKNISSLVDPLAPPYCCL